jgi:hypothetical protein
MASKRVYEAVAKVIAETTEYNTSQVPWIPPDVLVHRLADVWQELEMCQPCSQGIGMYQVTVEVGPIFARQELQRVPYSLVGAAHPEDCQCECHQFNREKWERACAAPQG